MQSRPSFAASIFEEGQRFVASRTPRTGATRRVGDQVGYLTERGRAITPMCEAQSAAPFPPRGRDLSVAFMKPLIKQPLSAHLSHYLNLSQAAEPPGGRHLPAQRQELPQYSASR